MTHADVCEHIGNTEKCTNDHFGNAIKAENAIELNKPTNISEVKVEYRKEKTFANNVTYN